MRKIVPGIIVALVAIIGMHAIMTFTNHLAGNSWPVHPLKRGIKDMPKKLGGWVASEAHDLDPRVFKVLDATAAENRSYRDDYGNVVSYSGAIFEYFFGGVPHSPIVCYPAQGWDLLDQNRLEITLPDDTTFQPALAVFEKDNQKVLVLFWFQFGDYVFTNEEELREAFEYYRPDQEWPSMVKVLMQMPWKTDFQGPEPLRDLAAHIYTYTRTLQDGVIPQCDKPQCDKPQCDKSIQN